MKETKMEIKARKSISKRKNKNPLNNFKKLFITEKDNLHKSQKNFFNSPKIKLGQR